MAIGITGSNPFQRQNQEYAEDHLAIYNQVAGIKPHSPKDVVPIFITKEGEVIANRFIDRNDDFYAIIDVPNKPKKFFKEQKIVDFKKTSNNEEDISKDKDDTNSGDAKNK